jgi:hypothetical protein
VPSASISEYNYPLFLSNGCIFHVVCEVNFRFYEKTEVVGLIFLGLNYEQMSFVFSSCCVRIKATSLTETEYLILIYLAADFLKPEGHR